MQTIALALIILLGLLLLGQGVLVLGLACGLRRYKSPLLADHECPKAAIVLCLRGTDPFLANILLALLEQDYPDYEVRIIIDSRQDPAWELVQNVVSGLDAPPVRIEALEQIRNTCSLKCSSLIQAVAGLDESYQVVAQIDADTLPHKSWLRELVTPLRDDRVGAATGNRWYMPEQPTVGAMVRYLWNACAIVQMYWYHIAWGGTLAVKTSVIRKCGLVERWGKAFCEDTMLYEVLRKEQLRVAFVPSLMMVNREQCTLGGFFHWVTRQLLTARLYHPKFSSVIAHGILVTIVSLVTIACVLVALLQQEGAIALTIAGAWIIYELGLMLFIVPMEVAVRNIALARGQPTAWIKPKTFLTGLLAVFLLQIVYPAALFRSLTVTIVDWRGVCYRLGRSGALELIQYVPFIQERAGNEKNSL